MKKNLLLSAVVLLLLMASPMHAQGNPFGGCVDSPENPTALLAVFGTAGALLAAARNRFRK